MALLASLGPAILKLLIGCGERSGLLGDGTVVFKGRVPQLKVLRVVDATKP